MFFSFLGKIHLKCILPFGNTISRITIMLTLYTAEEISQQIFEIEHVKVRIEITPRGEAFPFFNQRYASMFPVAMGSDTTVNELKIRLDTFLGVSQVWLIQQKRFEEVE